MWWFELFQVSLSLKALMKTFLSFCLIAVSFVASVSFVYADSGSTAPSGDCNYDPSGIISIPDALQRCKPR